MWQVFNAIGSWVQKKKKGSFCGWDEFNLGPVKQQSNPSQSYRGQVSAGSVGGQNGRSLSTDSNKLILGKFLASQDILYHFTSLIWLSVGLTIRDFSSCQQFFLGILTMWESDAGLCLWNSRIWVSYMVIQSSQKWQFNILVKKNRYKLSECWEK